MAFCHSSVKPSPAQFTKVDAGNDISCPVPDVRCPALPEPSAWNTSRHRTDCCSSWEAPVGLEAVRRLASRLA